MPAPLQIGEPVRFIDGKYKGFHGNVMKLCDTMASVRIEKDGGKFEVVEEQRYLTNLHAWMASMSATEQHLRGAT